MKKRIISAILLVFVAVVALIPAAGLNASAAETKSYAFSSYTAGTQYAKNEVHVLDEDITVVTNNCHFTSELRIYSSSSNNGYAIIKSTSKVITAISVNAGNKTDTLVVYGSNDDGANWTEAGTISVTSTSYKDYTLSLSDSYKWLKIDVKGSNQVRLKKMTLTLEASCQHTNKTTTDSATCTEAGTVTVKCNDCNAIISTYTSDAKGHSFVDGSCNVCNEPDPSVCAHVPGPEADCTNAQTCTKCDYVFTEALGHDYDENGTCHCGDQLPLATFVVPEGATEVDGIYGLTFTAPAAPNLPEIDYNHNYTFVGWATSTQEDGTVAPTLHKAGSTVTINEDTTYYAVYQYVVGSTSTDYELVTDVNEISSSDTVVITMTKGGVVYAISHKNGSSSAPAATYTVTIVDGKISGTVSDDIKWNIANSSGNLTIYPNGTTAKWLYCTNTNNGVRVGTGDNPIFTVSGSYLKNTGTSRFVGIYNTQDWRCYTTNTGTSNIANQTLAFYVLPGSTTYYTTNLVERTCDHANTTDVVENPTCTEAGSITTNCADCGEFISFEAIEATGHDYEGEITVNASCTENGTYTYTCANCSDSYDEAIKAIGHNYVDKMCSVCGIEQPAKVEISTTIKDYATENGWSNETKYTNMILDESLTATISGKTNSGKYYSNNHEWRLYQSESATITFTTNGGYTISSIKITYTYSNSGILCMGDTQVKSGAVVSVNSDTVTFSVGNTGDATNGQVKITAIEVTYQLPSEFTGTSLNVGSDLSIRYHAFLSDDADNYIVRFTMNGKVTEVKGVLEDGKYVFSFCGITPQCMGDIVKAELILNGEVIDTVEEYSVKSYVVKAFEIHADNAFLLQFLSDMLYYGAEAQKYTNYKTNALVTDGIELYEASTNAPAADYDHKSIVTEDGYDKTLAKFTAAGVNFDYNNRIFVKLTGSDLENVELYVNGALIEIEEIGEGEYIAYSYAISALGFEDEFKFELYYNSELAQTLTYTVADYVVAMQGDVEIGSLVNALYNYGMSAKEYDTNK